MLQPLPGTPEHAALRARFAPVARVRNLDGRPLTFEQFALNPDACESLARARMLRWAAWPSIPKSAPIGPRLILN